MHIQRRISITAPNELVWDVVTDLSRAKEWAEGFDDYSFISPDWPREGSHAKWRYHAGCFRISFDLTVTESIRGRSLQIANRSVFGDGLEVYSFTASGGVTTVWYDASDEPNPLGKIFVPLIEKRLIKQVDAAMLKLKEYCEGRARTAPGR